MSQMVSMLGDSSAMRLNYNGENPLSGELVLSDFDQSNLRKGYNGNC